MPAFFLEKPKSGRLCIQADMQRPVQHYNLLDRVCSYAPSLADSQPVWPQSVLSSSN